MKKKSLTYLIALLIVLEIFACAISKDKQLFKDSGQQLGNSFSWDVKLGDLDRDGDLDAVVANNYWEGPIQKNEIWLNNGDGTFKLSPQELNSSSSVTLFDVNNDGNLDIIESGDWEKSIINTWINDGKANFSISQKYPFKGHLIIFDNALSDVKKNEAITMERQSDQTLLRIYSLNGGGAVLKDTVIIKNFLGSCIATGDLNNDGYSDIVIGHGGPETGPTFILFNDGKGGFKISNQKLGNYVCSKIYLSDLNNDKFLDILQCNYHNPVTNVIYPAQLYLNDGTGRFKEVPLNYNSSFITPSANIVDLDNDGNLDIFLNHGHQYPEYSHKSEILFNDGHANFTSSTVTTEKINSVSVAFGDLDNDGDLDAFLACGNLLKTREPNRVWINTTVDKKNTSPAKK